MVCNVRGINIILLILVLGFSSLKAQSPYTFQKTDCNLEILIGAELRYSMLLEDVRWIERTSAQRITVFDGIMSLSLRGTQITNFTGGQIDSLISQLRTWKSLCENITTVTGDDPNGTSTNLPVDGYVTSITTTALLDGDAIFTSPVVATTGFTQLAAELISDQTGTLTGRWYSDAAGTDLIRTFNIPYTGGSGQSFTSAPLFGPYLKVTYTNGSTDQGDFYLAMRFHTKAISGQILGVTEFIPTNIVVGMVRVTNSPDLDRNRGVVGGQTARRVVAENDEVSNSYEDVWAEGGTMPFVTTAQGFRVQAGGNAADDNDAGAGARQIEITYINESFAEVIDTLTLDGALVSDSTDKGWHVQSARVIVAGTYAVANTGDIDIETTQENDIVTNIDIGIGLTHNSSFYVPAAMTAYITDVTVSVGASNSADVRIYTIENADDITTPFTSTKNVVWEVQDFSGIEHISLSTYIKIPEMSIIRAEAIRVSGGGSAEVSVSYDFNLIND